MANLITAISVEDLTLGKFINKAIRHAEQIDLGEGIGGTAEYHADGSPVDVDNDEYGVIAIDIERVTLQ